MAISRIVWYNPCAPRQAIARWRCGCDAYAFPIAKTKVEWMRRAHA